MATTDAQICNLALMRIGNSALINALSDPTHEAQMCNALYAQHRDALLAMHEWPFATRRAMLAELATVSRSGWAHAYALPADCLAPRRLWSGVRRERVSERIPFDVEHNQPTNANILLTDHGPPAELIYTARIETVLRYPPLFVEALAWSLAPDLAMGLAVKESIRAEARREAELARQRAIVQAINEISHDQNPEAEEVALRGVGGGRWQ